MPGWFKNLLLAKHDLTYRSLFAILGIESFQFIIYFIYLFIFLI